MTLRNFQGYFTHCHPLQLSLLSSVGQEMSTSQEALAVLCSMDGKRRSGVILAMHHKLFDVYLQLQ